MTDFLLFCIASVGMASIIVRGTIFLPVRQYLADSAEKIRQRREQKKKPTGKTLIEFLNDLISCMQCTGFWCGLFCGLFYVTSCTGSASLGGLLVFNRLLMWLCCGFAGSFLSSFGDILLEWVFFHKVLALRSVEEQDRQQEQQHEHQSE